MGIQTVDNLLQALEQRGPGLVTGLKGVGPGKVREFLDILRRVSPDHCPMFEAGAAAPASVQATAAALADATRRPETAPAASNPAPVQSSAAGPFPARLVFVGCAPVATQPVKHVSAHFAEVFRAIERERNVPAWFALEYNEGAKLAVAGIASRMLQGEIDAGPWFLEGSEPYAGALVEWMRGAGCLVVQSTRAINV
jgi:hypothetical protein